MAKKTIYDSSDALYRRVAELENVTRDPATVRAVLERALLCNVTTVDRAAGRETSSDTWEKLRDTSLYPCLRAADEAAARLGSDKACETLELLCSESIEAGDLLCLGELTRLGPAIVPIEQWKKLIIDFVQEEELDPALLAIQLLMSAQAEHEPQ